MVGSWIQIKAWVPYLHDIYLFVYSVFVLAGTQRNICLNDKPCCTANDAVAFTCDCIVRSGILSDERHKTLSRVLSNMEPFQYFIVPYDMIFKGYGDSIKLG
jgi:hypothetical protein